MCKPMGVTLPFVLLLMDWWPLRRTTPVDSSDFLLWHHSLSAFSRLVWEKIPLVGLSAISCFITFLAQSRGGAVRSLDYMPLGMRISNALVSYVNYLGQMVWPASLAMFYPHPASTQAGIPMWEITGTVLLVWRTFLPGMVARSAPTVSSSGVVMVCRDAGSSNRIGPGGQPGNGGPIHLHAVDRGLHRHRLGHPRIYFQGYDSGA